MISWRFAAGTNTKLIYTQSMQTLLIIKASSTAADAQVRSAYRKKGWAFTDPQGIEQCAQEGFSKALQEQAGEGCHMWGAISINKVGAGRVTSHSPAALC